MEINDEDEMRLDRSRSRIPGWRRARLLLTTILKCKALICRYIGNSALVNSSSTNVFTIDCLDYQACGRGFELYIWIRYLWWVALNLSESTANLNRINIKICDDFTLLLLLSGRHQRSVNCPQLPMTMRPCFRAEAWMAKACLSCTALTAACKLFNKYNAREHVSVPACLTDPDCLCDWWLCEFVSALDFATKFR